MKGVDAVSPKFHLIGQSHFLVLQSEEICCLNPLEMFIDAVEIIMKFL
jgi:hypothetical protein